MNFKTFHLNKKMKPKAKKCNQKSYKIIKKISISPNMKFWKQCGIGLRIKDHLIRERIRVGDLDIEQFSRGRTDGHEDRVDEASELRAIELCEAVDDLLMEGRVDGDAIGLHQQPPSLVIALRLDALHLSQQLAEQCAELVVVVDLEVGLAVG